MSDLGLVTKSVTRVICRIMRCQRVGPASVFFQQLQICVLFYYNYQELLFNGRYQVNLSHAVLPSCLLLHF